MLSEILEDVQRKGLRISEFKIDGKWHSFVWGNGFKKKGSYLAIETQVGIDFKFKNWKDPSQNFSFTYGKKDLDLNDLAEHEKRVSEFKEAEQKRQQMKWDTARLDAHRIWDLAKEDITHPYLKKKKLNAAHGSRVSLYGSLLIPAYDVDGSLWAIQTIDQYGKKMNLKNSKIKGSFLTFGKIDPHGELWIFEGFATAATIFENIGITCICTFSSHFFIDTAKAIKLKYPDITFIFSGDRDETGKAYAKKAAKIMRGKYLIPQFKTPHPDYTDWNDLKELEGVEVMKNQIYQFKEETYFPEEKFVMDSLRELDVQVDIDSSIRVNGEGVSLRQLGAMIRIRGTKMRENLKRGFVEDYLMSWHPLESRRVKNEFISQFFMPSQIDPEFKLLRQFMRAFLRRDDDIAIKVMVHFIWQVKRKMKGLPVIHHMMPIFWGHTGKGKSMAIRNGLLSPLKALSGERTLDVFGDDRVWGYFENHYAVFFDEMAKGSKHNVEMLKMVVTAKDFDIEPKYEGLRKVRQNATFIGSTNHTVESLIQDETSNRRFFAIEAQEDTDRETINTLDYLSLWQSVDETQECPILEVLADVKETQEQSRVKAPMETFLKEFQFERTHEKDVRTGILNTELLKIYIEWCKENGFEYGLNTRSLGAELKRLRVAKFESNSKTGFFLHSPLIKRLDIFFTSHAKPLF